MRVYIVGALFFFVLTACSPIQPDEKQTSLNAEEKDKYEQALLDKSKQLANEQEKVLQDSELDEKNKIDKQLLQQAKDKAEEEEKLLIEEASRLAKEKQPPKL